MLNTQMLEQETDIDSVLIEPEIMTLGAGLSCLPSSSLKTSIVHFMERVTEQVTLQIVSVQDDPGYRGPTIAEAVTLAFTDALVGSVNLMRMSFAPSPEQKSAILLQLQADAELVTAGASLLAQIDH